MSAVNLINIEVPAECFTPGKTYGDSKAHLRISVPSDMTPDRFREIVKAKGGRMGVACWSLSPEYGPVLSGTWIESGVEVYMTGVVDVQTGLTTRGGASHAA